jgi:hypothetical protein
MLGIIELFAFGTLWYFILTAVWLIALLWCVEKENSIGSGIWVLVYLCFLQFLAKVSFVDQVFHRPGTSLLWILGYFVIGFVWSFVKWWIYVHKKAEKLAEMRTDFIKQRKRDRLTLGYDSVTDITANTKMPESEKEAWKSFLAFKDVIPKVADKKGKISIWIMYWPVSMLWSLVNDFVKKALRIVIMKCQVIYDSIAKSAFKGMDV